MFSITIIIFCLIYALLLGIKKIKEKKQGKTESEFLSAIPLAIYYPKLDKGITTTISATAKTPISIKFWCMFQNNIKSYQVNSSTKQYTSPQFKSYDKLYDISNEDDNVLDDDKQLHLKFYKDLEKKSGQERCLKSGSKFFVVEILYQIFRYLAVNNLQYGILTTYNQHWFLKRPLHEPDTLYISPTIKIRSESPMILQCYSYIQHLARRCLSTGETLPLTSSSSNINVDSSDDVSGSDYKETL
ncbi:7074_t:CDS:2 [Dentiscutata erythropus]|uniref:7074_t:CDS:1 n=1 Tax=Dentiscutata erythropus TaxID=1348616 RepID=A0A9N9H4X0_9GLOM|nr:7074_t:CDS:2 [Dentiscutata erythropus]